METNFNFKSSVCTSREQSERLLALGFKKETADMVYVPHYVNGVLKDYFEPRILKKKVLEYMLTDEAFKDYIPAWSLHRLIEMMPPSIRNIDHYSLIYDIHGDWVCYMSYAQGRKCPYNKIFFESQSTKCYDAFIDCIEWLIKEGYFNKEYLV